MRYSLTDLGIPPGCESSRATAINDRGQIIGALTRTVNDIGQLTAFFWEEGRMCTVEHTSLHALNNQGQAVGYKYGSASILLPAAVLYENGRSVNFLAHTWSSYADGINDKKQIVVWSQGLDQDGRPSEFKRRAFVWENGKRHHLGVPPGFRLKNAAAINNQSQIIGTVMRAGSNDEQAILWDGEEMTLLGYPPDFNQSQAKAINDRGQVLARAMSWRADVIEGIMQKTNAGLTPAEVADSFSTEEPLMRQTAFVWDGGQMQIVDGLANAINNQGQVVGWTGCNLGGMEAGSSRPFAFVWQNGELADLNELVDAAPGWRLTEANGINNRGQIVGVGRMNRDRRAFLLTPTSIGNGAPGMTNTGMAPM